MEQNTENLILTLTSLLYERGPAFVLDALVCLGSLYVLRRGTRRYPRVRRLASWGLVGLFLAPIVFFFIGVFLAHFARTAGFRRDSFIWLVLPLAFVEFGVKAASVAVLIGAVMADRAPAQSCLPNATS